MKDTETRVTKNGDGASCNRANIFVSFMYHFKLRPSPHSIMGQTHHHIDVQQHDASCSHHSTSPAWCSATSAPYTTAT